MALSSSNPNHQQQSEDLKRALLDCVEQQKANILQYAECFYAKTSRCEQDYLQLCQQIVTELDKLFAMQDWDQSLFIRNSIKPLVALHAQAKQVLVEFNLQQAQTELQPTLAEGMQVVYVSLFQTQGHNLARWELILRAITKYVLGRPVYARLEDLQKMLRHKITKVNEAYAVVAVKQNLINSSNTLKDQYGSALLCLSDQAILTENIIEFVHEEKSYRYRNGMLRKNV